MLTNRRMACIQFGDCDPRGIVFYPRYFESFDACTDALFDSSIPIQKPGHSAADRSKVLRLPGPAAAT